MSQFNNMRLTTAGSSLLQQVHQGVELQLTKIVLGAGAWTDAQQAGTPPAALADQRLSVSISSIDQSGSTAVVRGTATNSGLAAGEGFSITEVGIIAQHPTAGEILYMADYVSADQSSYLSEATGVVIEIPLKIYIRCVTGSEVTIQIDDRFVSASLDDIDKHNSASNAHPGLRVQSPTLYFVGAGEIDEGGQTVIGVQGYMTGNWDIEAVIEITNVDGDVVTDDFNMVWNAALGRFTLTAPEVSADATYSIRAQLWEHGLIRSQSWSDAITLTVGDTPINQPTITSPADGVTGIGETPTITTSALSADGGQTHAASQFQVATTASFTSPVVDSGEDAANLTSYTVGPGALFADQLYYVRARHKGADGNWSPWSEVISFFTADSFIFVTQPSITSPATGATDIGETPEIAASAYSTNGTGNHLNTDWQVQAAGGGWSNPVWESLADAVHLESVTVPAGVLVVSTQYEVRCRYRDDSGTPVESDWSEAVSFTTATAFSVASKWAAWDESSEAGLADNCVAVVKMVNPSAGGNELASGGPSFWTASDRIIEQMGSVPGATGDPLARTVQSGYNSPQGFESIVFPSICVGATAGWAYIIKYKIINIVETNLWAVPFDLSFGFTVTLSTLKLGLAANQGGTTQNSVPNNSQCYLYMFYDGTNLYYGFSSNKCNKLSDFVAGDIFVSSSTTKVPTTVMGHLFSDVEGPGSNSQTMGGVVEYVVAASECLIDTSA
ncbi:MAG: hypothetical protein PWQ57_921 [Desulfovibrionales bacterium]|nr:hypothetical protein [Desulfovibrionales bacterium]